MAVQTCSSLIQIKSSRELKQNTAKGYLIIMKYKKLFEAEINRKGLLSDKNETFSESWLTKTIIYLLILK